MIGTTFKFDEAKVKAEGTYTLNQLHEKVDAVAAKSFLSKEEPGHYASDMEEHAFALVGRTILKLEKEPWFVNNICEWLLYEDGDEEDVLSQYRERTRGRNGGGEDY